MSKSFQNPALSKEQGEKSIEQLQTTLAVLNDWALTLKHAHWNVVGPNFIAIHEMLDPQIDKVRDFADEVGERIATLGGSPDGRSTAIFNPKKILPDYPINKRADALEHLKELDKEASIIIIGLRDAIKKLDDLDVISSNIVQEIVQAIEFDQWFYRSHLI